MPVDALVIGAGHNGLAAAAYLARAGLRTLVLERRPRVGGACVTEELWPGFRVSRAAYVVGLLRPAIVRELSLHAHGLRLLARDPASFTPLPDGRSLLLGPDLAASCAEIRRFSARDAERFPAYEALLDRTARTFEPLLDVPPPDPARPRLRDLGPLLRVLRGARRLGADLPQALRLLLGAARPVLEAWFESEPLLATLATDAVIGAWAAPSTPGTGYVLFHHVMGETQGARGVWAYAKGGMGSISEALAAAARAGGAEIRTDCAVERVALRNGRAVGAVLADGEVVEAGTVVSNADPQRTLLGLVERGALSESLVRELEALDFRSPSLKINVALARLPRFAARGGGGVGPHHVGTIHVGATDLDALERSFDAARAGRLPERPMVELTLPSVLDPGLAPPGRHVASLFVQHVPARLDGASWDAVRDRFADRVFALVDEVAPGFSDSVLEREVLAPPDLERIFGLTGGNLFHGAMSLDRLLFLRPLPGWSSYRTASPGLYLCGAGTHPGGGVMGACGRNAAREVLRDLRGR
ncbi:MAG: NAD(P)/FAD-dependent oxidoreductase [Deltaproteobacteria bacterium]|nr:MAG: NAD(P)/FAD-dependent oxidoreductase [Deltaproteobacteria bacterium]